LSATIGKEVELAGCRAGDAPLGSGLGSNLKLMMRNAAAKTPAMHAQMPQSENVACKMMGPISAIMPTPYTHGLRTWLG
jgi:hypothetical protein